MSWFLILCSRYIHAHASYTAKWRVYTRLCNDYSGMRGCNQSNESYTRDLRAAIYDYNPHLVVCHRRHSVVDAKVWLARRAWVLFNIIPPGETLM